MLLYTVLAGLLFGLYFSLVGLGLNLVFGVMRVVNLAHGDFVMLGAFLAFGLFRAAGLDPLAASPVAILLFVVAGFPLYYLLIPRLLAGKDPEMLSFILFFGFSQVIEAVTGIAAGTGERSIPGRALGSVLAGPWKALTGRELDGGPFDILGQSFPAAWVLSGAVSGLAVLLVYVYLYQTRVGYLTRAVMVQREEAISTGIDVHRVSALAFGVGLALAGVAGLFAPFMRGSITPAMGVDFTVTSFAVEATSTGRAETVESAPTTKTKDPFGPRWIAEAGTTSAPLRTERWRRAFTNWFGQRTRRGFGKTALSRMVEVAWLIWLSMSSSFPVPSRVVPSRAKTSTASAPCPIASTTAGRKSWGSVKITATGSSWVTRTMPPGSAAWTMLPGSTSRMPVTPSTGEAIRE